MLTEKNAHKHNTQEQIILMYVSIITEEMYLYLNCDISNDECHTWILFCFNPLISVFPFIGVLGALNTN